MKGEYKGTDLEWLETAQTSNITCPHCYYEFLDSWEFNDTLNDGEEDLECPDCGENFSCQINIAVSYSTTKITDEEQEQE
jgi:DNA-directed RNA polymerase subunit RPC12/RpoP